MKTTKITITRFLLYISAVFTGVSTTWASDIEQGKKLYQNCLACHGVSAQGNQALKAPALAGQHQWYLAKQLKDLQSGIRGAHPEDVLAKQMAPFVSNLTATDIINLSSYLSSLPVSSNDSELTGDLKNGYRYYQSKCGACHGETGQGNKVFKAPKISGLSGSYLQRQMSNFRNGIRGNQKGDKLGRQMALMARMSSGQELNDILFYLESGRNKE